jgi:hypothetical protein
MKVKTQMLLIQIYVRRDCAALGSGDVPDIGKSFVSNSQTK